MTHAEKHIIETYAKIFERLSSLGKLELLEKLAKSIKKQEKSTNRNFMMSFGAFESNKSAEELVEEIKKSRKFRDRELKL